MKIFSVEKFVLRAQGIIGPIAAWFSGNHGPLCIQKSVFFTPSLWPLSSLVSSVLIFRSLGHISPFSLPLQLVIILNFPLYPLFLSSHTFKMCGLRDTNPWLISLFFDDNLIFIECCVRLAYSEVIQTLSIIGYFVYVQLCLD